MLGFLALGVVTLVWKGWGVPRALAVEVRDYLGLRLVEDRVDDIVAAARESRVEPALIAAVMYVESRGRGSQTSRSGAHGLMQLIPGAAADAARRLGLPEPSVEDVLEDDALNIRLGAAHLAWLLEHRDEWGLEQVLVSYNAGRVKLFRWIERHGSYAAWRAHELEAELSGEGSTGALRYALGALEARRVFLERGVFGPLDGVEIVD